MTQARPKAFKVMSFHRTLGKEKPFLVEWVLCGCHLGVAGGPGCRERDCAREWDHPKAFSRTDVRRGTRSYYKNVSHWT